MFILSAYKIYKRFGGLVAVDGATINVKRGSMTLIIGPNGSGKTTLVNVITGVYRADGGKIIFEGRDITREPPHGRARLGIVRTFQNPRVFPKMTVLENLLVAAYGGRVAPDLFKRWLRKEKELEERAFSILKYLRLDHLWDKWASELSGGQMKLLEIGRAILAGGKLIVMDEPLAGVHPTLAHEILTTLKSLTSKLDVTFLIVEHRLDIILEYADYAYAMALGRVIAEGDPRMVVSDPAVVESYLGKPIKLGA